MFEKEDLETKLELFAGSGSVTIMGSRTCTNCGKTYPMSAIYAGDYDVPRPQWADLVRQHGKSAEV